MRKSVCHVWSRPLAYVGLIGQLVLLTLLTALSTAAENDRAQTPFYPLAVWYGGGKARAPMLERLDSTSAERWGKDLDQIKSLGFTTIKCWVDWATAEPRRGEFTFANLDLLLKLAERRGMRVIIQIYLDSAPDWVGRLYPEGRFVDRSGAVIVSQAAPGYCIDDAGIRREMIRFLQALSREANRSPVLYGWDVWSEPHVINWAEFPYLKDPEFCFCSHTQARFRRWLQAKYQSLDALNHAWYRNFASWSEVETPRYPTILSYTDYIDWRTFIADKLAADLKTRVEAIRSMDKAHPITSHAAAPGLFTSPTDGYGEPDDWAMSATADFFGTSLYPRHSESARPWTPVMLAAGLDFTRSAGHSFGKGFWIGELQAGQGVTGMRIAEPVTAAEETSWIWEAIAHGAREIAIYAWYPMSSGFESNGYGLIHLDGSITPRAREAGNVARVIQRHAADVIKAEPVRAQVAIFYNRLSYMVGGSQPSLSRLGNPERDSLEGLYRVFYESNIPVDFVDAQDVAGGKLSQYKLLFLPFPVMLSRQVAEGIKHYVEAGGTAVAEARLAWNDARGAANEVIPGFGLDEVFGAKERVIVPADRPQIRVASGQTVSGAAFEEALQPLNGARVIARFADGEPAIVENLWGKGKAILIGSFVALAYQKAGTEATKQFILGLAQDAGVTSDIQVIGNATENVEVRRLESPDQQIAFVFNHSKNPVDMTFSVTMPWPVRRVQNLVDDSLVPFQAQDNKVLLRKDLAGDEVWIVILSAASAEP